MRDKAQHVDEVQEAIDKLLFVVNTAKGEQYRFRKIHPEAIASVATCIEWHRNIVTLWETIETLAQSSADQLERARDGRYCPRCSGETGD